MVKLTGEGRKSWSDIDQIADKIHRWANTTFPDREPDSSLLKLVMEEIPELLQHKKKRGLEDIGTEWADCIILLLDLARIWNIDIPSALYAKMLINIGRQWTRDPGTGFYNHLEPARIDFHDAVEGRVRGPGPQAAHDSAVSEGVDSDGGSCD